MRLPDAASSLGISETALKHVCRKLGVARWPRILQTFSQHQKFLEPERASAQARGHDPLGSSISDTSAPFGAPHASGKRKRSPLVDAPGQSIPSSLQSASSSLQPHLPHPFTNAQVLQVPSLFQQGSMGCHQLLATQWQADAGRQGFIVGADGAVGLQMPSLLGREGFGGAARAGRRVDTGVSDTLFSCIRPVASPRFNAANAHVELLAAAGAGPSLSQVKDASQSEYDYHLDLQALEEHTAFPPLSCLLAQGGGPGGEIHFKPRCCQRQKGAAHPVSCVVCHVRALPQA